MSEKSVTASSKPATPPVRRSPSLLAKLEALFPPWVGANIRSKRSWKILLRCWVACWASFIIILPQKSLRSMGNACFLSILTALLLPPFQPIQMYILSIATMLVGMCFGWGFGAAAMRAALAVRNQEVTRQSLLIAQQSAAGAVNPEAIYESEVFHGMFLDAKSSIIYGVFLGVGSFIFACARAYLPKLFLMSVFGSIVLDVFCSYGPLFPVSYYTVPSSLLISTSMAFAIGLACEVLIFPETMAHQFLDNISAVLGGLKAFTDFQGVVLNHSPDELFSDADGLVAKSAGIRSQLVLGLQGLAMKSGFVNAEFSRGRWNGDDSKALEEPCRLLVTRTSGFHSFLKLVRRSRNADSTLSRESTAATAVGDHTPSITSRDEVVGDTELIRQLISKRSELEERHNLRLEDVFPLLRDSTQELRGACSGALGAVKEIVDLVNTKRWTSAKLAFDSAEANLDAAAERLRRALENYRSDERFAILRPYLPFLQQVDAEEIQRCDLPLRSLIVSCVFTSHLVVEGDSLLELTELVRATCSKRRAARFWAPAKLRAFAKVFFGRRSGDETSRQAGEDIPPDSDDVEEEEEVPYKKDPDSRPPSNIFQKLMNGVHGLYKWSKTPEAVYAFKYTIITIIIWLPSVFTKSAYFAYAQKFVWAMVMAQTTLNIYVSDQIFNYVARLLGTFAGLILGLLCWYIGNAKGNGTPYGTAASVGVFLIPIIFNRINSPVTRFIPNVMMNATFALIVGYSWMDGHLPLIGNPGIGWSVAWKRWLLVVIGCAVSFFFMLIPPVSGRKAVRLRNAVLITELSSLYSLLMSAWISHDEANPGRSRFTLDDDGTDNGDDTERNAGLKSTEKIGAGMGAWNSKHPPKWLVEFRRRIVALALQIANLRMQTNTAWWEGNFRGAWPIEEYFHLIDCESDMLVGLAQLAGSLGHLDPEWRVTLNARTLVLNPNFITDVMSTFALVSQSLRTGEPMHQIIPTSLLDRLLHHTKNLPNPKEESVKVNYVERVQSPEFMYFASAVAAVSQILNALDDLHRTAKRLCGEVPFKGFEEWRTEYEKIYGPAF